MAKRTPADPAETPDFEAALGELETIVDAMEQDSLSLEQLVAHYEKGSTLLNRCEAILKTARKRLETITSQHQAENPLASASDTANDAPPHGIPDDDHDDDIRLF